MTYMRNDMSKLLLLLLVTACAVVPMYKLKHIELCEKEPETNMCKEYFEEPICSEWDMEHDPICIMEKRR